jgi:hypothetical protein
MVSVPVSSSNVPFVLNEPPVHFKMLNVQGQVTYRIIEAKKAAAMQTDDNVSFAIHLSVESQMPASGVIFSDGLDFKFGATVTISIARERANLVKVEGL